MSDNQSDKPSAETAAPKRRWFRFTLRDMLLATALIAMGTCGLLTAAQMDYVFRMDTQAGLWYASGGCIGAGLFVPLKHGALGAIVGFMVLWAFTAVIESIV